MNMVILYYLILISFSVPIFYLIIRSFFELYNVKSSQKNNKKGDK